MDGRLAHVASSINITENKNNEALIRDMAEHDPLTALPNRRKFMADLDEIIEALKQNGGEGYLFFMDLDDFKEINDTLGHIAGDTLLSGIGKYFLEHEAVLGRPYRYGGDEFVIIAVDKSEEDLERIRNALLERFSAEWELANPGVLCGISIGAVKFSGDDTDTQDLIRRADAAMYEVKKSGKHGFHLSGRKNHA
ncbi:hypothetical protein FACS1894147_12770 [Spirochaetia bacterium]|nr:hypothetical protein FACS1894147_12770 [Spirochaetia bacterium]